jgi:hypothetical protein
MKTTIMIILPFAAIVLLLCGGGCSVVGYTVGSAIDNNAEPTYIPVPQATLFSMQAGELLRFEEDGQMPIEGAYEGLSLPTEEDILAGVKDRGRESTNWQRIEAGDRVRITEKGADEFTAVFLGAGTNEIWYHMPDSSVLRTCRYPVLARLRSGELEFTEGYLQLFMDGKMDGIYDVQIAAANGDRRVPMCRIDRVFLPEYPTSSRGVMAAVGAVVDIAALVAISSAGKESGRRGDSGSLGRLLQTLGSLGHTGL